MSNGAGGAFVDMDGGVTLLLAGLDWRPPWRIGRADAIILARASPAREVRLVSVPRDLFVTVPGQGQMRVNEAYRLGARNSHRPPFGGEELLRETLERNLDIKIDLQATLDFYGFQRLVDALGGIELDVRHRLSDAFQLEKDVGLVSADFWPGRQRLDGPQVLAYVRSRNSDSDAARRQRLLQVTSAIVETVRGTRSPRRLLRTAKSAFGSVRWTGRPWVFVRLAWAVARSCRGRIEVASIQSPLVCSLTLENGKQVLGGDMAALSSFVRNELGLERSIGHERDATPGLEP